MAFVIRWRDDSEIALQQISSTDQREELLGELDAAIVSIEEQIDRSTGRKTGRKWLIRTKSALRHRRMMRPRLQERIAQLRRAEKSAETAAMKAQNASRNETQRRAFIIVAKDTLKPSGSIGSGAVPAFSAQALLTIKWGIGQTRLVFAPAS